MPPLRLTANLGESRSQDADCVFGAIRSVAGLLLVILRQIRDSASQVEHHLVLALEVASYRLAVRVLSRPDTEEEGINRRRHGALAARVEQRRAERVDIAQELYAVGKIARVGHVAAREDSIERLAERVQLDVVAEVRLELAADVAHGKRGEHV